MALSNRIPNQFQKKSLELVNNLLELSSSIFFLVEPDMQHRGAVVSNAKADMEKEYTSKYGVMDPLNPARFNDSDLSVVTLDSQISPHILKQTLYYQEFMQPHNHRYVADIFFRNEGKIIAILSLLRDETLGNYTPAEITLLEKIQPFLEYSLNTVYLPQREQERSSVKDQYQFTDRELDVLELLISGANNKQIAAELNIGLATIKTHLHHIFQKTSVQSRSELVSKIVLELQQPLE